MEIEVWMCTSPVMTGWGAVQETIRTQSDPPPVGYLANYKLLTKKKSNTWPFSERSRRVRTQCPFDASNFVQPFISFFFVILAKFLVIYRHNFFFIQNKISIYMILSFLTMYRSAKKSTFITSRFPALVVCNWLQ